MVTAIFAFLRQFALTRWAKSGIMQLQAIVAKLRMRNAQHREHLHEIHYCRLLRRARLPI
jgi:hypothetical protein